VHLAHGRRLACPQARLELEVAGRTEEAGDGKERQRVDPVQDRRGTSVLQHPGWSQKLRHGPADDGEHGEARVPDLRFLHGVEVELLGEAEGIEAIVTSVGAIEGSGTGQEGDGDGVGHVGVAAAVSIQRGIEAPVSQLHRRSEISPGSSISECVRQR